MRLNSFLDTFIVLQRHSHRLLESIPFPIFLTVFILPTLPIPIITVKKIIGVINIKNYIFSFSRFGGILGKELRDFNS